MKNVDVLIVGAATTGSYLARRMAERGLSVLVIDKLPEEKIGTKYDIFHIGEPDFARFQLPMPVEGEDYAFRFSHSESLSAYGRHSKPGGGTVIGMHLHGYTLRLNRWAQDAGAEIEYEAAFDHLLFDAEGHVCGAAYIQSGETIEVHASLVADCSGIPSVARRALPDDCLVENFAIAPDEMFYVILRYVDYPNAKDWIKGSRGWTFYKTWEAPQADPHGAIIGIGANLSFETAERIYSAFEKTVKLPQHTVTRIERGATPYRRPPYSFVTDGFVAMGDAACLTKPSAGEGVTSSMVQADIVVDVAAPLLMEGKPLTLDALWPINTRYVQTQGQAFASQLAMLPGAVATNAKENDFFFEKDIIFSKKSFEAMGRGEELAFPTADILQMAVKMLGGVLTGRLRISTIRALLKSMGDSGRIAKLYASYPETPSSFDIWKHQADAEWAKCSSMAEALKKAED
ncbi:MAG: hypothetical protein IKK75_08790 [Clostridia bacterium]|nr:hypothetical protein [Clostridia bacterium]